MSSTKTHGSPRILDKLGIVQQASAYILGFNNPKLKLGVQFTPRHQNPKQGILSLRRIQMPPFSSGLMGNNCVGRGRLFHQYNTLADDRLADLRTHEIDAGRG